MWLAAFCGVVLLVVGLPLSAPLVGVFTSDPGAIEASNTYLSLSLWGLPAMLLVIAAMGLLRGLQNTKVPLVVAISGFAVNAALNAVFIYGFGWGIAGSAIGTVIAQWGMAVVYIVIAIRAGRELGVSLRPGIGDPRIVFSANAFMVLRTLTLRASSWCWCGLPGSREWPSWRRCRSCSPSTASSRSRSTRWRSPGRQWSGTRSVRATRRR